MSKFLILFLFSFLGASSLYARQVKRGAAELLNEKSYSFDFGVKYFTSTGVYDNDGNFFSLDEETSFSMLQSDFKVSYGFSSDIEIASFFRARSNRAKGGSMNASVSGPEALGISGKYSLPNLGKVKYAIGVHYYKTLYTNATYTNLSSIPDNELILGDDGTEYGAGLLMTLNHSNWSFDGHLLYVSPPNDLSSEVNYKIEGNYDFTSSWWIFGGVSGIYSLNRNQLDQKPIMARGSTLIFNSLNRELIEPYMGLSKSVDKSLYSFVVKSIVKGRSTDRGHTFELNYSWSSEGVTPESKKIDKFKEYTIEGSVLKVSARGNFIKIDQGLSTDVEKGMKFDVYQTDYFGGNVLVGSGYIYEVGADWSVIKLTKKYGEIEIKPGFAARGY